MEGEGTGGMEGDVVGELREGGRPVVSLSQPVNAKYNPCTSLTHIVAR